MLKLSFEWKVRQSLFRHSTMQPLRGNQVSRRLWEPADRGWFGCDTSQCDPNCVVKSLKSERHPSPVRWLSSSDAFDAGDWLAIDDEI